MTSTSGAGGYRPTTAAPAAAQSQSTVREPKTAEELQQMRDAAQGIITKINAKPADKLTGQDRASYARAQANDKVLESYAFLSYLGEGTADKLSSKVNADMDKFLRDNPKATREQIQNYAAERFKVHVGEATVGKFAFDQALKMHQENMERMKDAFDF